MRIRIIVKPHTLELWIFLFSHRKLINPITPPWHGKVECQILSVRVNIDRHGTRHNHVRSLQTIRHIERLARGCSDNRSLGTQPACGGSIVEGVVDRASDRNSSLVDVGEVEEESGGGIGRCGGPVEGAVRCVCGHGVRLVGACVREHAVDVVTGAIQL